jgi:hypothetical protein
VIPGSVDIVAVAAGTTVYPWRALARGPETVIERASDGHAVAWFPAPVDFIVAHPSGRAWAGAVNHQLYLIRLEEEGTTPKV